MTERLIAKLDRLGAEAGIDTMTPAIRQFALLVSKDLVAQWPQRPWVGLTDEEVELVYAITIKIRKKDIMPGEQKMFARTIDELLKLKNT
jgi:hypothetical protein